MWPMIRSGNIFDTFGQNQMDNQNPFEEDYYHPYMNYEPEPASAIPRYENPFQSEQLEVQPPQVPIPEIPVQGGYPGTRREPDYLEMMRAYSPETKASEAYAELLRHYPQKEPPGIGRRAIASMIALKGGPEAAEKVMYAPYMRDVSAWKEQVEPAFRAAELENRANINERTLLSNSILAKTQMEKQAELSRIADEKNRIQEQRYRDQNEVALIRANAYRVKNNGAEVTIDKGSGQVVATWKPGSAQYPKGHVEYLGKVPGSSTAAELADIAGGYRVEAAEATGKAALERTAVTSAEVYQDEAGHQYEWNSATKTWKPMTPGAPAYPQGRITKIPAGTQPTQNQLNTIEQQKFKEVYLRDPYARKWFTTGSNNTLQMKPRPTIGWNVFDSDADKENRRHWDRVKQAIDPTYQPPMDDPAYTGREIPQGQGQPNINIQGPEGRVTPGRGQQDADIAAGKKILVQDRSGRKFTITPENFRKLQAAKPGEYTQVR